MGIDTFNDACRASASGEVRLRVAGRRDPPGPWGWTSTTTTRR
ncbi:hypothetical protein QJS66_01630 [Kocuria rhizophila]|nr:hypothetical protein QJS66_01630 [Kocuria rhizophila]